jgi:hypothetical protein
MWTSLVMEDITESKMFLFLAVIVHTGHDIRDDNLKAYWSTTKQFFWTFYGETVRRDKFLHS